MAKFLDNKKDEQLDSAWLFRNFRTLWSARKTAEILVKQLFFGVATTQATQMVELCVPICCFTFPIPD